MKDHVFGYVASLIKPSDFPFDLIEQKAKLQNVPIMERDGIAFLKQLIRLKAPKRILEIGAAIGYSSLQMASVNETIHIVTVERDRARYDEAVEHIKAYDKHHQIELLLGDAFDIAEELNSKGPYDMIFIDAAKGQYQRFFETFTQHIQSDAVIITDNVLFKGYVSDAQEASKRLAKLSQKIDKYNQWLSSLPGYETIIVPIGDGVAITTQSDQPNEEKEFSK
ncbi:putative O-methyltransferase YrrM [Halolactibacillus alkaliphilus]|uniref:tRNA 5-hydroxyuridine methyltransferase n=1 Tax=Halolactibacillus alkaliphilus TaxID=442899 RepID=A0A511WZD4_9BACI|nr:O-methyltransferase [Halolactibacillus alkaliphilus]GEN56056.1 putative O-methyltransferase YrrM [Halolactibacillus alkaliphilus]GGN67916.1 putative O-methyltransferase YrrM [Halolactibacillus alkaliphilus]SFO70200.1 Predicted O-methyltransferase YrrM [Halolactibacillus alkaliphilus]